MVGFGNVRFALNGTLLLLLFFPAQGLGELGFGLEVVPVLGQALLVAALFLLLLDEARDLGLVALLFADVSLVLSVNALVQDALELGVDLQAVELVVVLPVGQHLYEHFGVHLEVLGLDLEVEVKGVIPLLAELELLQVDLDAHVAHEHVLQGDVFSQVVCAPVR